jgi:hypothetical protein
MKEKKKHKSNPFPFRLLERKQAISKDNEVVERMADKLPYCKMYVDIIPVALDKKMGISGLRVLFAILRMMLRHKEHVFISAEIFSDVSGGRFGNHTYYKGINELIELDVIAPSATANMYWVNTNYLFKGDRAKMFRDKRWDNGMFNT